MTFKRELVYFSATADMGNIRLKFQKRNLFSWKISASSHIPFATTNNNVFSPVSIVWDTYVWNKRASVILGHLISNKQNVVCIGIELWNLFV